MRKAQDQEARRRTQVRPLRADRVDQWGGSRAGGDRVTRPHRPFAGGGPRDPRKPYRAPTEAQAVALRVFRLRGLYTFANLLSGPRATAMRSLIDDQLRDLGAETQTDRQARQRLGFEAKLEQESHDRTRVQSPR